MKQELKHVDWGAVIFGFCLHVIADGIAFGFGIFTPYIIDFYSTSRQTIGWLNSLRIGVAFLSGPLASSLSETLGYRLTTMVGAVLASIGIGTAFFYSNFMLFFFSSALLGGLGLGFLFLPTICITSTCSNKSRVIAIALAVCGSGVGSFLFGPVIGVMCDIYTWKGALLILSGIMLNCCVCAAFYRPVEVEPMSKLTGKEVDFGDDNNNNTISFFYPDFETGDRFNDFNFSLRSNKIDVFSTANEVSPSNDTNRGHYYAWMGSFSSQGIAILLMALHEPQKMWQYNRNNLLSCRASKLAFVLFILSNCLTSLGLNVPYLFITDRAILGDIAPRLADYLVSFIALGNILGRGLFGLLSSHGFRSTHLSFYIAGMWVCGLIIGVSCYATSFLNMTAYTIGFGIFSGVYMTMTPVILVDLLGLDNLNDTVGLTFLFSGLFVFAGPPLAGAIFDRTESYDIVFCVCGCLLSSSGLVLIPLLFIKSDAS